MGVIWRTFFTREAVHNAQRSCGEGGGFGVCFDCDHVSEKAEMSLISDTSPVLHDNIDAVFGADLKVQQGPTKMLKGQVRVLLPLK